MSNHQQLKMGTLNQSFQQVEDDHEEMGIDVVAGPSSNSQRRKTLTEKQLTNVFEYKKINGEDVLSSTANYIKKYYKPSGDCLLNFIFHRLPFFDWIRSYDLRQDLVKDLIAGLTIGVVHIPQGMAYALMAGVPAINGLYVSFFNVILYVLLGTSKHLSTGTYAIVSLIVASSVKKYSGILYPPLDGYHAGGSGGHNFTTDVYYDMTTGAAGLDHDASADHGGHHMFRSDSHGSGSVVAGDPSMYISDDPVQGAVMLTMTLSLLSGLILVGLGLLHVGFVTKYLSDSIVNGFTCGAAFHVIVSQIGTLLGLKLKGVHIPFVVIGDFIDIFSNILDTHIPTLLISIVSCIVLFIVKMKINEKYKKKLPAPIPVELIVVVVGTVVSYFGHFGDAGVKVIGDLPLGFPAPRLPNMEIAGRVIGDAVTIAIVSFALNVSMAKLFAKKHKYEIRANQELFSYGVGNIVSSFFSGFPGCVGLSRCVILDGVGGRTQVNGIFASILILIVVLFLGPLFKTLPNACLASIIVIALKNMALEFRVFPKILKKSKLEALGWLVTYAGVMILDVDVGLYIGVAFSLLLVIFRTQRARSSVLGNIPGTSIYEDVKACQQAQEFETIKIIRYEESIYYANVDNFKYKIMKLAKVDPGEVILKAKKIKEKEAKLTKKKVNKKGKKGSVVNPPTDVNELEMQSPPEDTFDILEGVALRHIIIDCSCINYIDSQGMSCIQQLADSYREIGIHIYLTYCKRAVIRAFNKQGFNQDFDYSNIFATTDEAVRHILKACTPATLHDHMHADEDVKFPAHVYKASNDVDYDDTISLHDKF